MSEIRTRTGGRVLQDVVRESPVDRYLLRRRRVVLWVVLLLAILWGFAWWRRCHHSEREGGGGETRYGVISGPEKGGAGS